MSTNPGLTTTYRHNICGSMAERHDNGPGIIHCGDVPQNNIQILAEYIWKKTSKQKIRRYFEEK